MEYNDILKELENVDDINFTMYDLIKLSNIFLKANCQYSKELFEKREDAKERYDEVYDRVYEVAFDRLKDKLGFEDEVIERIITLVENHDNIKDIYVIDGNVIARLRENANFPRKEVNVFMLQRGFIDINSNEFNNGNDHDNELLVNAFNSLLKTLINDKDKLLLDYHNGVINYNDINLHIYINHNLDDIMKDSNGLASSEILIKYNNMLLSFDMIIRNNCVSFKKNDYQVNVISSMLNENTKVYKK